MNIFNRHIFYALSALLLVVGCNKESEYPDRNSPILFSTSISDNSSTTKATVFDEDADLADLSKGGGNFSVRAYKSGTEDEFLYDQRVWYFDHGRAWHFYDDAINNVTEVYWPNATNIDFFTYMPYHNADQYTGVTLKEYTAAKGPSFSCKLPLDSQGQENIHEFIYAYSKEQNKNSTSSDGRTGVVQLNFVHPFSLIVIQLNESYRMTINWIKICGIYNKGTYANPQTTLSQGDSPVNFTCASWTPEAGAVREDLAIHINKNVPDDINYKSPIGGPYIVMPQRLDNNVILEIDYTRDQTINETKSISLYRETLPQWDPGKKYTYSLTMGDPLEEILFNVAVEEWSVVDYKNEIGVE